MTEPDTSGVEMIAAERLRQQSIGYDSRHDSTHRGAELRIAAAQLLVYKTDESLTTHAYEEDMWGLINHRCRTQLERLTIAGALVAAEIDRLIADADEKGRKK